MSTRIGILGYGNLGRGVECAIRQNEDMELVAVFTRRDPSTVSILTKTAAVCNISEAADWKDKIDVMILCGGSATDLPEQTPGFAKLFNVVDSFDTHAKIPEHFANVDKEAKANGTVGIISVGWDPGMFSLNRLYAGAILPEGTQLCSEFFLERIDVEADDMDVMSLVFSGKFNAGNKLYIIFPRGFRSLRKSVRGVVVGQSKSGQPLFGSVGRKFRGSECAVGTGGMCVKIDIFHGRESFLSVRPGAEKAAWGRRRCGAAIMSGDIMT